MTTPTPEPGGIDVAAIRARVNSATTGPWEVGELTPDEDELRYRLPITWRQPVSEEETVADQVCVVEYEPGGYQYPHAMAREDAEFIAHAREDVPALLALVEQQRAEIERLTEESKQRLGDHFASFAAVERVLDGALGPDEEDGTGDGQAADVALVVDQRDEARAAVARLEAQLAQARAAYELKVADFARETEAVETLARVLLDDNHSPDGFHAGGDRCRHCAALKKALRREATPAAADARREAEPVEWPEELLNARVTFDPRRNVVAPAVAGIVVGTVTR